MSKILPGMLFLMLVTFSLSALALEHAMEGTVTKVDSAAKTIAVKTADGAETVFKVGSNTLMHVAYGTSRMLKRGTADSYLAGKEGTHVVVRYTGEGAEKTATAIDDLGKNTLKISEGTVTDVDNAAHTVSVKTEAGSKETYDVARDATIDTKDGVVRGSEYAAKVGEKATVHYTEEAGHKVAHFIKHL